MYISRWIWTLKIPPFVFCLWKINQFFWFFSTWNLEKITCEFVNTYNNQPDVTSVYPQLPQNCLHPKVWYTGWPWQVLYSIMINYAKGLWSGHITPSKNLGPSIFLELSETRHFHFCYSYWCLLSVLSSFCRCFFNELILQWNVIILWIIAWTRLWALVHGSVVIYSLCIVVLAQKCCWSKNQGSSQFRELNYWERFVLFC